MTTKLAPGLHVRPGRAVDTSTYDQYIGRWSQLFVPLVIEAAAVHPGDRVLDVSTGTGEAALAIMPVIGTSGSLIGADIAPAMLDAARGRLKQPAFLPAAANGQALPFADGTFDAVVCQFGLQFFPDPGLGLKEFRRVLRAGRGAGICVISSPDRAPMWGVLADVLGRLLPEQRRIVQFSFSLADPARLESLLISAGFQEVRVERQTRKGGFDSFEEYWEPIEAGIGSIPQIYLTLPSGVILRLNDDGSTPTDNPFFATGAAIGGEAGANIQKVYSYGHRNGFGIAFDPYSGSLWDTENADDAYSELNRVIPGMNGGWVQLAGPLNRIADWKFIETTANAASPPSASLTA